MQKKEANIKIVDNVTIHHNLCILNYVKKNYWRKNLNIMIASCKYTNN